MTTSPPSKSHANASKTGIIVGAGIAGIATALFSHDFGVDLDIYEQDSGPTSSDHLLWLAPNGLRVLERLGLIDAVLKASVSQNIMGFTNRRMESLLALRGESLITKCSYPIVAIKRCDLMSILFHELDRKGLKVRWGQTLTKVEIIEGGSKEDKKLRIDIGGQTLDVSYLIGADGIGSQVRAHVAPEAKVHYQGIRTWLGRSDHVPIAPKHVGQTLEVWGTGTRFVLTSMDGKTVYWSALERDPQYVSNSAPIPDGTLNRLNRLFTDYHADVRMTLHHGVKNSLVRCNFGVVTGVERPFKDNIILVGDAAHGMPPNMGQGASLGLEDGLWTAYGLATAGVADFESVFNRIAAQRALRVKPILKIANSMNQMFQPESSWGSFVRDRLAGLMPETLAQRQMESLYQPSFPPHKGFRDEASPLRGAGGLQ